MLENPVLFPEIVIESNGVACGDQFWLFANRIEQKIFFSFYGSICDVANHYVKKLEQELSGKEIDYVFSQLQLIKNDIICRKCMRQDCALSPILLLERVFEEKKECAVSRKIPLSCDACVAVRKPNWSVSSLKKKISFFSVLSKMLWYEDGNVPFQKKGAPFLDEMEKVSFEKKMKDLSSDDLKRIKRLRLAAPYFNNSKKYSLDLNSEILGMVVKQKVSLSVAQQEIEKVNRFIKDNSLKIESVKGAKTGAMYATGLCRTHMDFDFVALHMSEACSLIQYLIFQRGFKFVSGGSVPFSFKVIQNQNAEETLLGHIHLEKILQNQYQVIVDVNIGGFPLGRSNAIIKGKLTIEDVFCISLSHLYKHEFAYMKDVNDLYMMLDEGRIDKDNLLKDLNNYGLMGHFSLFNLLCEKKYNKKFDIQSPKRIIYQLLLNMGWPYSTKAHFFARLYFQLAMSIKRVGWVQGIREVVCFVTDKTSGKKTNSFSCLCRFLNERTYLYPIVIFKNEIEIDKTLLPSSMFWIESMGIWEDVVVFPFGLFLIQNVDGEILNKKGINEKIRIIYEALKINFFDFNYSYIMEARKDTWLY